MGVRRGLVGCGIGQIDPTEIVSDARRGEQLLQIGDPVVARALEVVPMQAPFTDPAVDLLDPLGDRPVRTVFGQLARNALTADR
jgi:hypothetical protein